MQAGAAVARIRSFNRSVTRRIGALSDRFLGRDHPLSEARLIYEIGRTGSEVRDLRARFGLDSGYLSRLLRSLERQGLVSMASGAGDRRVRRARLTAAGLRELRELDRRSDAAAVALLAPLNDTQQQRLVQAMAEVERLLRVGAVAWEPVEPAGAAAHECLSQHYAELTQRFDAGFDPGDSLPLVEAPGDLTPSRGIFLVARIDGRAIGCGALKTIAPGVGYLRRMWVARPERGLGLGRRLLHALEGYARSFGLSVVRLETNRSLKEAQALYRRGGRALQRRALRPPLVRKEAVAV